MVKLKLTIAFDKYDYLQPLREGLVEAEGIDLNLLTVESGIRHERMFHYGEYDACEFSMSSYLVARGQDVDWLQAIPFFPRRMWGHKFCFIKAGSGIKKPADLKGGRIGLRSYENTLALVTKGMLMNSYDLGVSDVTWVIVNKENVGPSCRRISKSSSSKANASWKICSWKEKSTPKSNRTCHRVGSAAKAPSSGCFRILKKRRRPTTRAPKCFRSCTRSSSKKKFLTAIPGWPQVCMRL